MTGWALSPWGLFPWAIGSEDVSLSVVAVRENVVRLGFRKPIYISNLLDAKDASRPELYTVTVVEGTTGLDGRLVRPVSSVEVAYTDEVIAGADYRKLVDVTLDRPMSPYPAQYQVSVAGVWSFDLATNYGVPIPLVETFTGLFKAVEPVRVDPSPKNRDFHNPQTRQAMFDPISDPNNVLNLGAFAFDDTGDYAHDEGITSYKKRILRRLCSRKDAYVHLKGYGVGILQQSKKLALAATKMRIQADAEAQIAKEPETLKVRVAIVGTNKPGLFRINVLARTRSGQDVDMSIPVLAGH